jgi:hypothetical protein
MIFLFACSKRKMNYTNIIFYSYSLPIFIFFFHQEKKKREESYFKKCSAKIAFVFINLSSGIFLFGKKQKQQTRHLDLKAPAPAFKSSGQHPLII